MRTIDLKLFIPNPDPDSVYRVLADFERYADFSDAVRSVTITGREQHVQTSLWEVNFRAGVMRWTEEDTFDRPGRRIVFRQLEGDVALFDGSWDCTASGEGSEIAFSARLDLGVPSLADALEPIAVRALVENTLSILTGLFGSTTLISSESGKHSPVGTRQ